MNYKISELAEFEQWLLNRGLSQSSVYQYVKAVQKFVLQGNPDIEEIENYNEFILEYAIKKRSLYYYDALKIFLKYVFKDNAQKKNQMLRQLLKPNKNTDIKRTRRILDDETKEQVIKLLKDYKHRIIARIQNETGVRAGDILRLKRGTISYEAYQDKTVMRLDVTGKGDKHYVKWIFDENIQNQIHLYITSHMVDDEYYFLDRGKVNKGSTIHIIQRTNYHHYWSDMKQSMNILGIDFKDWSSHDFRRGFARRVWQKTKDPVLLKEAMNHSQFDTTLLYLRNSGVQVQDLQNMLNEDKK